MITETKAQLKSFLIEHLGPLYDWLVTLFYVMTPFLGDNNLHWIFILSTLVIAFWFYRFNMAGHEHLERGGFWRFLLPKQIFLHRSAILDYKFFIVNSLLLRQLQLGSLIAGFAAALYIADGVRAVFNGLWNIEPAGEPSFAAKVCFSVAMALTIDFGKFISHYLQHRAPLLWEFHKVHHSAEVLTPITNSRIHPVDFAIEHFTIAITTGPVIGAFAAVYPTGITELTILNFGFIWFLYFLQNNLRHSHIPLAFNHGISHVFSSPVMHQIHHSAETRHFDKNFALTFSFWDYLAGTLYIPQRGERFALGLAGAAGKPERFDSLLALYLRPFQSVFRLRAFGRTKSRLPDL